MSFQGHFLGYGSLKNLVDGANQAVHQPAFYADCFVESVPARTGMEYRRTFIQAAWLDGEVTHFWRWHVASVLMMAPDQPLDDNKARRASAAIDSAWSLVLAWLRTQGHGVVEASLALPADRTYLDGQPPDFLDYGHNTSRYSLLEKSHAPAPIFSE